MILEIAMTKVYPKSKSEQWEQWEPRGQFFWSFHTPIALIHLDLEHVMG